MLTQLSNIGEKPSGVSDQTDSNALQFDYI